MNNAFNPTMSTTEASAEFERLKAERRAIEARSNKPDRVAELTAKRDQVREKTASMKKQLADLEAKTALLKATRNALVAQKQTPKSKFQTYRELQKSDPVAAGKFWNQYESEIVSGQ